MPGSFGRTHHVTIETMLAKKTAPFGSWKSPLSAADIAARIEELCVDRKADSGSKTPA